MSGAAEEGTPETTSALRTELERVRAERDDLKTQLKAAKIKEQLLLNRVEELQTKYEKDAVRSPSFQRVFGADTPDRNAAFSTADKGELAHVERIFTQPGSLGLKLNEVSGSGRALVVKVNKGSQGEQHEQAVGMLIKCVADIDVSNMPYKEVLGVLKSKAKERPLKVLFQPRGSAELTATTDTSSRPKSMSKPARTGSGGEEDMKSKQRQYSLSHPGFAPVGYSASTTAPSVAAKSGTEVSRRTSVFAASHPDFAAAAAAAQISEGS